MNKQTSDRVSSIASEILNIASPEAGDNISPGSYNLLLEKAKTLAGSALSQDETPGQETAAGSFIDRMETELHDLALRISALTSALKHNPEHFSDYQRDLANVQKGAMKIYYNTLDARLKLLR